MKLPRRKFLPLAGALALAPALSRVRFRARLSDAADHDHRAVSRRRAGRYAGAAFVRADARRARPAAGRRECRRRWRQHRCGARRARRARRLHHDPRQLDEFCRHAGGLSGVVRREERFRCRCAVGVFAADAGRPEVAAGEQRAGADCVAQGQPRQGDVGHHRHRQPEPGRRHLFSETHRHANPAGALSRRGAGIDRPARRPDRPAHGRRSLADAALSARATRSRRSPSWTRRAGRRRPTSRPSRKPACPSLRCRSGRRSGCRKSTPDAVVARLNAAAVAALADPGVRRRLDDLGQEIPPREQQTPQALGAFHRSEIDKWWPIIKAAGIKPE